VQTAGTAAMIVAGFCPCSSIPREWTNLRAPRSGRSLVVQREPGGPVKRCARQQRGAQARARAYCGYVSALAFAEGSSTAIVARRCTPMRVRRARARPRQRVGRLHRSTDRFSPWPNE
jgi:hypothetical protein